MATAASHLSIEEFHRLYDGVKPYREYWFGEAIPKPMPTSLHGAIQFALMTLFRSRGWKAASEVRLKIVRDAEPVPDVIASRDKIEQPYPTRANGICVEILSPEDRLKNTIRKANYYIEWGFQCAWIVDPNTRSAWIVDSDHCDGLWIHPDGALTAEGIEIPLPELFAEVDNLV